MREEDVFVGGEIVNEYKEREEANVKRTGSEGSKMKSDVSEGTTEQLNKMRCERRNEEIIKEE